MSGGVKAAGTAKTAGATGQAAAKRYCRVCGKELTDVHFNTRYCRACKHQRELESQRVYQRKARQKQRELMEQMRRELGLRDYGAGSSSGDGYRGAPTAGRPRKPDKGKDLTTVAAKARAAGVSYGKYVAENGL